MSSPIVDDEGCDFLCTGQQTLAELIETDGACIESAGDAVEDDGLGLLTFHVG
jgi:hypothetical protein